MSLNKEMIELIRSLVEDYKEDRQYLLDDGQCDDGGSDLVQEIDMCNAIDLELTKLEDLNSNDKSYDLAYIRDIVSKEIKNEKNKK